MDDDNTIKAGKKYFSMLLYIFDNTRERVRERERDKQTRTKIIENCFSILCASLSLSLSVNVELRQREGKESEKVTTRILTRYILKHTSAGVCLL